MAEIDEVQEFTQSLVTFHNNRITEQDIDQLYYDDDFGAEIPTPFKTVRTGSSARIINNIVAHIETAKPQAHREPKNTSEKARKSTTKVVRYLNYLLDEIVPEITESVWNGVLRGEGWFQVEFNPDAYKGGDENEFLLGKMPVIISSPDPLITYGYPYDATLPTKVVKQFEIDVNLARDLVRDFPLKKGRTTAKYTSYFSPTLKSSTADGLEIDNKKNVLGFTPFVHFYGGFGKRSPNGKPETMAVGKLRHSRGRLKEECQIESQIYSIIALYANPINQIQQTQPNASEIDKVQLEKTSLGPGTTIVTGFGWQQTIYTPNVATAQLFAHLGSVKAALGLDDPPIMSGVASSSRASGRQEDIEFGHIQKKYATLINNLETALGQVMGMTLRILDTSPQALPITFRGEVIKDDGTRVVEEQTITKDDIDGYYDCKVELNPDESLEDDRNFMKFRLLANEGRISWKEFLMEGMHKTEHQADETIAETIAEKAIINNPLLNAQRDQEALERMGLERLIEKAKTDTELQRRMKEGLAETPQQGGQVRPSEARNPAAAGTARQLLGGETPGGIRESAEV